MFIPRKRAVNAETALSGDLPVSNSGLHGT
jgi:hypothetical protein